MTMNTSKLRLMKPHRTVTFCAAAALAPLALAGEPAPSAPSLAITEATLDFCAKADPKSADRYWEQGKALLQGVPQKTAAQIRKSDEYRQAYDSTTEMIGKVPEDALRACTESLAANR
jgi:hypothetical protein